MWSSGWRLGVDDQPTGESRDGDATLDGGPVRDATPAGSLEHRRLVNAARRRLFGDAPDLCIGRYRLERPLGAGGMGEVYLAHDDRLDRSVAIKRVRVDGVGGQHQERLRREARALARLSHPNVVQVYEVDEHEGQTFVVMEYIDGQTLGRWLAQTERSWNEVLEVFLAAARGLIAAHEAGLVHRDFKPDNVLLGSDGSVRVVDFGLVLAGEDLRDLDEDPGASGTGDARLSQAGAIIGTIRYMSFEQLCGQPIDARSDQFSFCLSLYEALWGEPPFSLSSCVARLSALDGARPMTPTARRGGPPAAIWRAIRRGLQRDSDDRWPDMRCLCDALERVVHRRRRLVWMGSSALALGVAGGAGVLGGAGELAEPVDPCAVVERELVGTWGDEQRAGLERQVAGLSASHVGDSQTRIVAGLDAWASEWVDVREQTCRAGMEHHTGPDLARAQEECLTRHRHRVEDLVALLLEPGMDGDVLADAVDAVVRLPDSAVCGEELALLRLDAPAPAIADEVAMLRRQIDRVEQLRMLGRVDEALTLAEQHETAARELGFGPVYAEALRERASAEFDAGSRVEGEAILRDAIDVAELNHHDALAADLWVNLTLRTIVDHRDLAAAEPLMRRMTVASGRMGDPARLRIQVMFVTAAMARLRGETERAEQLYRDGLRQAMDEPSLTHQLPYYRSQLASIVASRAPNSDEVVSLRRDSLETAEVLYGPLHPLVAREAFVLGNVLIPTEPEEARALLVRAAAIWQGRHSRPHPDLARAHLALAKFALNAGELDVAESHAEVISEVFDQSVPRDSLERVNLAWLRMTLHGVRGEHEDSIAQARIGVGLLDAHLGPGHPDALTLQVGMVGSLLALGRVDQASERLEALLPLVQGQPDEALVRMTRAEVALMRGDDERAHEELMAIGETAASPLGDHEFSYALLRALTDVRRDRLGPSAMERLTRARHETHILPAQISAWLDQLDVSPAERATLALQ